jgi:ribonuclease E
MATCPECEFDEIDTTDHEEGDELSCPECGKNLILAGPDELEVADDEDDDEDDEDLDDEEEEEDEEELDEEGLFDDEDDFDEEEEE